MVYNLKDKRVKFKSENHYIAPGAHVMGNVEIGDGATVWFNAVLRGDTGLIVIGDESNIQDGCVLHAEAWNKLVIGRGVTVGHKAMLHGCTVGDYSLIGINSVILDDAVIGKNCIVGANSLVKSKMVVPDGTVVMGSPAKVVREVTEVDIKIIEASAKHYSENGKYFRENLVLVD
ncbi:MAG TPA: gamma carbonic anhydrase family protein [Spirochaetota bacterium]|jgi:carbonic anhydrase/acetyltransferase-like protein (isoleucine patch superfamily)|nr:gamma carbonic anhydrase family protein [Spirochaetota bacterium]OQA95893.1 MAG: 2,3,4,5-tetrahydropyridine-2,6-dicarboxylate N-acetyltransferase [Spirochaetes bacterium ADurb.Bin218]HOK01633.1 gamma carbonic anhydrase family protein [Spirochaetota bacterium]HOK91784.1 gamma carbonic anhydrase family protein [Spirochaetota bacterium]HON15157.1 gamma carbonic anhydrase family protein [Spirochaetota bacterium]